MLYGGISFSQTSFGKLKQDEEAEAANTLFQLSQNSQEPISEPFVNPISLPIKYETPINAKQEQSKADFSSCSYSTKEGLNLKPEKFSPIKKDVKEIEIAEPPSKKLKLIETREEKRIRKRLRNKQLAKESRDRRKKKHLYFQEAFALHCDKIDNIEALLHNFLKDSETKGWKESGKLFALQIKEQIELFRAIGHFK